MANVNFDYKGMKYQRTGLSGAGAFAAFIFIIPLLLAFAFGIAMLLAFLAMLCINQVWPGFVAINLHTVFFLALACWLLPVGKSGTSSK
jgi:hypothetical protein